MGLEVALLESDPDRGVQILGRTADPKMVRLVREFLVKRLLDKPDLPLAKIVNLIPEEDPEEIPSNTPIV